MRDVLASEWLKLRSLRSTRAVLVAAVAAIAVGWLLATLITADWDSSPPQTQAAFSSADMSVVIMPVLMLAVAAIAALTLTGEYGTGMIRTTLVSVPDRRALYGAKVLVVGLSSVLIGLVTAFALFGVTLLVVGDRPAPIAPWASVADGLPTPLASGAMVLVVAMIALGLGAALRSTAGALVTVTLLLFVLPTVALLLPAPWDERISSITLLRLGPGLAGDGPLSQTGAILTAVAYIVIPLGVGWLRLSRTDA